MPPRRITALTMAAGLVLAACSGSNEPDVQTGTPAETPGAQEPSPADPAPVQPSSDLTVADIDAPDVDVLSVPSGDTVNVAELALGQDILFWFYAPH